MPPDAGLLLWINGFVGKAPIFDKLTRVVVSDYFIPVSLSLILVALWFGARSEAQRERNQSAVICACAGLGIASLIVWILNAFYDPWPRPFVVEPALNLLFYEPTDPSFPSNPAAISFALATGVWFANRRLGIASYFLAAVWSFSRVYAGVCYPVDIAGGAVIGFVSSYFTLNAWRFIEPVPTLFFRLARWLYLA